MTLITMQIQGSQGCELEASVERALQPWKAKGRYHLVQKVRSALRVDCLPSCAV